MRPFRILLARTAVCTLLAVPVGTASAGTAPLPTVTGTVRLVVVDAPGSGDDGTGLRTTALADVAGRLVALPREHGTALTSGERVTLTGVPGPDGLLVRSVSPAVPVGGGQVGGGRVDGAATAIGPHTLTVLPVYWSAPDPATRASLTALAASTARYWSDQSGGRLTIAPTVRDWARIPDPGTCDPSRLANAALAADGVALPVSTRDHVMFYFPARQDCQGWAGLGQIGGSLIWVNGVPLTDVAAHEFGHNLGLGHANTETCTAGGARVTLSGTCTMQEYHDYADVMGAAMDRPTGNLNAALADRLGLATTVTVPAGGRATVDLAPLGQVDGVRAVRLRVGTAWLYVDDRPAVAPDTRWPAWAGVQLHLLPDADYPATRLLDGQPAGTVPFIAAALPPGVPWAVPGTGLTLTVATAGPTGARVTVAPTTSDAAGPGAVVTAPAARALTGPTLSVAWRLTAEAPVRVLVDGTVRATVTAPARTGTVALTGLPDGEHVVSVQAVDGAGTVVATSAPVPVTTDATPPATPAALALAPGEVLTWHAATDVGSGLGGYLVALDGGAPVRSGPAPSWRVRTPEGRHTWWVAAVDRAGNLSPAAGLVVVRTTARTGAVTVRAAGPVSAANLPRTLTLGRTVGGLRAL